MKEGVSGKHCLQHAVLRDGGTPPADNFVRICTLPSRRSICGSRHLAKPLGRYLSCGESAVDNETEN